MQRITINTWAVPISVIRKDLLTRASGEVGKGGIDYEIGSSECFDHWIYFVNIVKVVNM